MLGRRLGSDRDGVSTVVSAVLVFALILMVLGVYMSTIVPDQVAASEARHMRRVSNSLGDLSGEMVTSVSLDREGEFATQVELGTTHISSLAFFESSGTIRMVSDAFLSNFICESPRVISRDGHASPGSTFEPLGGASFDFQSLDVAEVKVNGYTFAGGDDTGSLIVSADGSAVATLVVTLVEASQSIKITTYDAASRVVIDQYLQTNLGPTIDSYTFNALDDEWGFASLIADSDGPFTLTTSSSSSALEAYVAYWEEDGTFVVLGDGRDLPFGFQRTVASSVLVFRSSNAEFLDQTYSLEAGAVVLDQEQGEYLTLAPFSLKVAGGQNLLRLTLLNLTGTGQVVGSHQATISTTVSDPTLSLLQCSSVQILVSSGYPNAWHGAWVDALAGAGLPEGQAALAGSILSVQLTGTWIVILQEARASVRLT